MIINNQTWTVIPISEGGIQNKDPRSIYISDINPPLENTSFALKSGDIFQFSTTIQVKSISPTAVIAFSKFITTSSSSVAINPTDHAILTNRELPVTTPYGGCDWIIRRIRSQARN